ncbi:MAG: sensor histidine kinase [Acidobacteriota bacterium]
MGRLGWGTLIAAALVGLACAPAPRERAVAGQIDLREWRPADGPVRLNGVWDFWWGELVPPGGVGDGPAWPIDVPRFWNRTVVDADGGVAGRGVGTYRITVKLPPDPGKLAIRVGNINTAVTFYAGREPVWKVGDVSPDPSEVTEDYRPGVALLPALDGDTLELTAHVSSHIVTRGGLDDPVWLGSPEDLVSMRSRSIAAIGLIVGGLATMGVYHLYLFALRRRSRISFYFGLVCFSAVGRLACSDELLIRELWPEAPWWLVVKGIYFFAFSIFGCFVAYLRILWPHTVPLPVYLFVGGGSALGSAASLLTPVSVLPRGILALELFVVASLLVAVYSFGTAMRCREKGRWLYAAGFSFVGVGAFHDVIVSQGLISGSLYLGPVGVFVFLVAQSMILAQGFSHSLTTVERQRGELQRLVNRLEREKRERQRYEELSLAASGLAHETKNPLGIIRGLAQRLLASSEAAPPIRRRAGQILDQADKAASRLGDFLSYARLRDPDLAPVDLGNLLRYAAEVLAPDLEGKGIPHRVEVRGEPKVLADEEMLLQIVLNLMLNSIAASGEGDELVLRFEAGDGGSPGRLAVIDHGGGIPDELIDKVRKPYITGRADGHGLGLALVERLSELHGWTLHIESQFGEGTRIEIRGLEPAGG